MQILIGWKSRNLSEFEALARWTRVIERWRRNYQPLVNDPLHIYAAQTRMLFLGLIAIPGMFLEWQAFDDQDDYAVAWSGIAYNLFDLLPHAHANQMNDAFVSKLQEAHDPFLQSLDGRFIAAVLHRRTHRLQIITANGGLSPCFLTDGPYGIAIGTRIAPLLELVGKTCVPNRMAMLQLFALDWCLGTQTPFEGVTSVEPGMSLVLSEDESPLEQRCYFPPHILLKQSQALVREDYLARATETLNATITAQMRHAKAPLMNLTGGKDSRVIVASAVASGYRPECDVSGSPDSKEIALATDVARALHVKLHCLHPGLHYAEHLAETFRLWNLWTEGTIPIYNGFARSAMALSPERRKFFAPFRQFFSGIGGEGLRSFFYGNELLFQHLARDEVITRLCHRAITRYRAPYLKEAEFLALRQGITRVVDEAEELGLTTGHEQLDYFYWKERVRHWGGAAVDSQQIGRHVFAPLCQTRFYAVAFALTIEQRLSAAWHHYHLHHVLPAVEKLPFLSPPPLSGMQKFLYDLSPGFYTSAWTLKHFLLKTQHRLFKTHKQSLPLTDQDKLGVYFQPYLQQLLFARDIWWPTIIDYEHGRQMWEDFVAGKAVKPLWNLVVFELWARQFLG